MIVSELKLYNFRKFRGNPGLSVTFHRGLNALIGENDSGKTAIIDAIKLVLLAQGNEYVRPTDEDFFQSPDVPEITEFRIDLTLSDFTKNEAKNFIEYLCFEKTGENISYYMYLHYRAWKGGTNRIFHELLVGKDDDSIIMDSRARELLKVVYLKPLRDAEREMSAGRNSRISQILLSHPVFKGTSKDKLIDIFKDANQSIVNFFLLDDGQMILQTIRDNLESFNDRGQPSEADLKPSELQLKAILESLSLDAAEIRPGLGELNLLFIAAELLLLKDDTDGGLKLALIEELEAHLHPQAQLRLINYLQNEYYYNDVQIIISTHSPILASKINLKNLILVKNGCGFDLSEGKTGLQKSDYLFLQRFLDSTKANLFFAKGIIMVEGDAENILIPVIADIIGCPLEKYGISLVNVGNLGFFRYSRILIRSDKSTIGIPVSVITDCDVKPYDKGMNTDAKLFDEKSFAKQKEESRNKVKEKQEKYEIGCIRAFVSPLWTLEYCLALSCLRKEFHRAVHYGKKIKNTGDSLDEKIREADGAVDKQTSEWKNLSEAESAYNIFKLMLDKDDKKSKYKAIVAQCLASILRWEISATDGYTQEKMFDISLYGLTTDNSKRIELKRKIEADQFIRYIVDAIKYAAGVKCIIE